VVGKPTLVEALEAEQRALARVLAWLRDPMNHLDDPIFGVDWYPDGRPLIHPRFLKDYETDPRQLRWLLEESRERGARW